MSADSLKVFLPEDQWKEKARQKAIEEIIQRDNLLKFRKSYIVILNSEESSKTDINNN